jgi:UDP-N-acetylmuramyl pentapeptide phosphotransferase/UDP-N-acetylglucosamine-1-phosphate transferase
VSVLLGVGVGLLAVRLLVGAGHDVLRTQALERSNHRGHTVPTAMGVLVVIAVVLVEAGRSLFGAFGIGNAPGDAARLLVVLACVGFGLLGLIDDVAGTQTDHGFRGHVGALLSHGRMTTGLLKIVGGGALAVVLVSASHTVVSGAGVSGAGVSGAGVSGAGVSGARVVVDALIVALAANLTNLFDRAPGRAIKVGLLAWVPFALVARADSVGVAVAPVVGAFAGLLGDDLRERLMLGDAGSNVIGAVLGLAVVLECGPGVRAGVLAVLVALTVASELISFSRVIERVSVLRWLDELGRGA